jgi:3-oxoacyl-(acyl-carrier-protein) synthase
MERCYINGVGCVSVQNTFEGNFLENPIDYSDTNIIYAVKPNYKDFIPPAAIRRMSAGVKNSVVASSIAMNDANVETLDGIITGTGMGCIQDSEKFLDKMIEFNEEYLTPTSFIQSTHNTVSGQIALKLKCNAYNFTYVNTGGSFPSALLDGVMQVKDEGKNNILIGGIDEIAEYTFKLYQAIGHIKKDGEVPFNIFENRSEGSIGAEGAVFFVLGNEKKENSYAEIIDTHIINNLKVDKVNDFIQDFLQNNDIKIEDVDTIILGNNGDINFDSYYDEAEKMFQSSEIIYYKHLFGEFMTAPSISLWVASNILKNQEIPSVLYKNNKKNSSNAIRTILIYNQYRGKDHSLILMKNV